MTVDRDVKGAVDDGGRSEPSGGSPGKRPLTDRLAVQRKPSPTAAPLATPPAPAPAPTDDPFGLHLAVQRRADGEATEDAHAAAARGTAGPGASLPHLDTIQRAFGHHDVSAVQAHTDGQAAGAARSLGAEAFAFGHHVAFRDTPSLHTAAHEAAHVVQQRAGVHLAGGVGAEGDAYERHADEVADLVVQGKSAEALLDRHAGTGGAAAVQRKVDSHFGEWFDDVFTISKAGTRRGIKMELRFKPKGSVDAELIGLTQTAKSIKSGKAYYINNNATTKAHSIGAGDAITVDSKTKETDEGAHIDQADYNRNPLYAAEGAPGTDTKLDQTKPDPDVTKGNDWGRHGFRYDDKGTSKEQDALLKDDTGLNDAEKDSAQIYETTALAIAGNQKDTYYGSVEWGWRTDSGGAHTKVDLKLVSEGVPSSTFLKSAELWNAGKTKAGADTLDLPTVDVKVTKAPIAQKVPPTFVGPPLMLPKGTRVQVVTAPTGGKHGTIKVVDGDFVGMTIEIDSTDAANLADERA